MPDSPTPIATPPQQRGPLAALYDLFSNVRFGIVLLAILFVYMTIGSAGVVYPRHPNIFHPDAWAYAQMRQWRPFEMTEFEWFHWWPFKLVLSLIALNIIVTTLRRIRFKPVNYGVWTIHAGVLTLMLGCVIYFGTKVEGDALVVRRRVVATVTSPPNEKGETFVDRVEFVASPGRRASVGRDNWRYDLEVIAIEPEWEMRSEEATGTKAYSVNVQVRPATPQGAARDAKSSVFVRQLIAGHPEHTEDVIFTGDEAQPMQRAKKALGKPLVDDAISLELDYESQRWIYLRPELEKCWALYLRKPGDAEWTQRPIEGVPFYNDCIATRDQVFQNPTAPDQVSPHPIDVEVPAVANDPFPNLTVRVTGYLRYAQMRGEFRDGGRAAPVNPVASVVISSGEGRVTAVQLEALDPVANRADQGLLQLRYAPTEEEFQRLARSPSLHIRVPALGIDRREPIRDAALGNVDAPWFAVATDDGKETGYAYRVVAVRDELPLSSGSASLAIIELRTPKGSFRRWAFDDARLNRDATEDVANDPHAVASVADPSIEITYEPGHGGALVCIVAGPDPERLRMIVAPSLGNARIEEVHAGEAVQLPAGITIGIDRYEPRAIRETKPFIVPSAERVRDAGVQLAQILVEIPGASPTWLPFHDYVFDSPLDVPRRHPYRPLTIALADGTQVEVLFSRQRLPLPAEVALEDFVLATHVGGFTGEQATIRDYTSLVRFRTDAKSAWTEPITVSVNKPIEYGGYSFFQAQWDPPEEARGDGNRASLGLNYTVLGVGNRHGVWTMLLGCCIAVVGMMYAFYVKPVLKRRARDAALAKEKVP